MRFGNLCKGRIGLNLFLMVIAWVTATVNYAIINLYMKYVPGSVYVNFSVSGASEILAHIVVGVFYLKLTPRWTFFIGYAISIAGSICLVFQDKFEDNSTLVAFFVLFVKFGISMSMCACYISTPFVFPIILGGTAFAICNAVARFSSIASPTIVEMDGGTPMIIFSALSIAGLLASLFISTDKDDNPAGS